MYEYVDVNEVRNIKIIHSNLFVSLSLSLLTSPSAPQKQHTTVKTNFYHTTVVSSNIQTKTTYFVFESNI